MHFVGNAGKYIRAAPFTNPNTQKEMKYYKGLSPCPGCGRTGEQVARKAKDALCHDCEEQLRIGRAIARERQLERNYYKLDDLIIAEMTWYTIPVAEIDKKLRNLLRTFSVFDSRNANYASVNERCLAGRFEATTGRDQFVLPRVTLDAAKELCEALKDACRDLKEQRENYRKELNAQLAEQKDEIFNQGVARGRNLLLQLNRGEITIQQFEATQKRF